MILAADIADFMNNNLIELLNYYVQRATFHRYLCPFIWKMESSASSESMVSSSSSSSIFGQSRGTKLPLDLRLLSFGLECELRFDGLQFESVDEKAEALVVG